MIMNHSDVCPICYHSINDDKYVISKVCVASKEDNNLIRTESNNAL